MGYKHYFTKALALVNQYNFYILIGFISILLIEFIVLKIYKRKAQTVFIFILSTILILLGLETLFFAIWGGINYYRDTWDQTVQFLTAYTVPAGIPIGGVVATIIYIIVGRKYDVDWIKLGIIWLLTISLSTIVVMIALGVIAVVLYTLFIAAIGMYYAAIDFFEKYWLISVICISIPIVVGGFWTAMENYFKAMKSEIQLFH